MCAMKDDVRRCDVDLLRRRVIRQQQLLDDGNRLVRGDGNTGVQQFFQRRSVNHCAGIQCEQRSTPFRNELREIRARDA